MRNRGFLKGACNSYSTICKFFTLLVHPHDTADRGDEQIQSRWPGFLAPCSSFPFEQARRRKGDVCEQKLKSTVAAGSSLLRSSSTSALVNGEADFPAPMDLSGLMIMPPCRPLAGQCLLHENETSSLQYISWGDELVLRFFFRPCFFAR